MKNNLDDETLKMISYVSISSYRLKTVQSLKGGEVKIPTQIAKDSGIRTNHISKVLRELKEANVIECINCKEARKGRLYRLTDVGEEIVEKLD